MAVAEVPDVDLLDPSLYRTGMPHELYAEMRAVGPVLWHPQTHVPAYGSDIEFWALLGHREVEQANRDWETFSTHDGTTIVPSRRSGEASCSSRRIRRSTTGSDGSSAPASRPA